MDPITLADGPPEHPILDYDGLVREGLRQLERMSDGQWTDFNSHDPGITILETLCYALTDIGYRIFHPVPDLLANGGADARANLFSAGEVLSGRAVTIADLRRVAIDVQGVKNAWVEPAELPSVRLRFDDGAKELSVDGATATATAPSESAESVVLRGLYRVLIEKSDLEDIDGPTLRRAVARRLHAHRNLCEDFDDIRVLDTQPIAVYASVEIGELENAEHVLVDIYERIATYISPAIPFLTLTDLLARGVAIDDAFDGPALDRGFVDEAALNAARRRRALYVSDLVREITGISGVRAVRRLRLGKPGLGSGEPWTLTLDDPNTTPKFSPDDSRIDMFKGPLALTIDEAARKRVAAAFGDRLRSARLYKPLARDQRDAPVPAGTGRDVATHVPLEAEFPLAYGIGRGALPPSTPPARLAAANQLRGYLAFFDQMLANTLAQLAHVGDLLSFDADGTQSYFSQPIANAADEVSTVPALAPLFAAGFDASELQAMIEPPGSPSAALRRNRFLNHLLARFAEEMTDDPLVTAAAAAGAGGMAPLLAAKRAFLRRLPWLGGGRGSGVNYLASEGPDTVPPLAERLRLKLALPEGDDGRFFIVEHILLRAIGADAVQNLPFLAAAESRDPFSLQLSFVFPDRLKPLAPLIERLVREETPAHLVPYIHWLGEAELATFAAAYGDWLAMLRRYALGDTLGLEADSTP
ncbi:MAG: hypothetical protein MUE49_01255 [Rhodospirillales bacterium]|jgi:hypothetical protein|nr:hypothetical protein [Rhodospirillales bacterium]